MTVQIKIGHELSEIPTAEYLPPEHRREGTVLRAKQF